MVLQPNHLAAILAHAERSTPEECCGILIGRAGRVEEVVVTRNLAENDRERRYAIDVRALIDTHKRARELGLEILGYYHSHPEGAARPSALDLEQALPGAVYLIVALAAGRATGARGWRLENGAFGEEPLEIHAA